VKELDAQTIEAILASQDIRLAPGRAQRLALALNPLLAASAADASALAFDQEPAAYFLALARAKSRP
jgi:hypothetical protein